MIEKNIKEFLEKKAKAISEYEHKKFIAIEDGIESLNINSPIEQLLYITIKYLQKINDIPDCDPLGDSKKNKMVIMGLNILPQYEIAKYSVDFYFEYGRFIADDINNYYNKKLVVECDSKKWHDRNENDRRYEKARERFIVKQGFKIFRYTGSEIFKTPILVAKEILEYLTDYNVGED